MKTARRQELRTNDLSQQIDQFSAYVKQNAAVLTIIVCAAAILTAGGFWFVKNRHQQVMNGWALLSDNDVLKDPTGAIGQFRALAEEKRSPELTLAAWLRIGEIAMSQLASPESSAAGSAGKQQWSESAANAYNRVLTDYPNDITAVGQALIALGVLAEDQSNMEKARQYYQRVLDDSRFAETPFLAQAKYRLHGLANWSQPVVFAPAPVTVPVPDPLLTPTSAPTMPIVPVIPGGPAAVSTPAPTTTKPVNVMPKG